MNKNETAAATDNREVELKGTYLGCSGESFSTVQRGKEELGWHRAVLLEKQAEARSHRDSGP